MFIIRIETNNNHRCWYKADVEGDPGRTLNIGDATKFNLWSKCTRKILELREIYPNRGFSLEAI